MDNLEIHQKQEIEKPPFRELAPIESWGAELPLPEGLSREQFLAKLLQIAKRDNFAYSGYLETSEGGAIYHLTRNPRKEFKTPYTPEELEKAKHVLEQDLGITGTIEAKSTKPEFRILLGLEEGYFEYQKRSLVERIKKGEAGDLETAKISAKNLITQAGIKDINVDNIKILEDLATLLKENNFGKLHTPEEVKNLLPAVTIKPAEIFSASSYGPYTEPAALITGDPALLPEVYNLATKLNQQRLFVEDLHKGKTWVVETAVCTKPDNE